MWIISPCKPQAQVELLPHETSEALLSESKVGGDELHVRPLAESVLNHLLVLLDRDATRRVDKVAAGFAGVVDGVDSGKEELFLGVRQDHKVLLVLVGLDRGILSNDARARARRVEKDSVKPADDLGECPRIVVAHDDVPATESVYVSDQTLATLFRGIIGEDAALVAHQRCHVRRLATRSRGHIENTLPFLRSESHDGEERRCRLEYVMSGQVLGRST